MKQRIRLTESDLHRIVSESVNKVINEAGFMDKMKGAYNGMKQGFNTGQQQMDADRYRNYENERNSSELTDYAMRAYKILANCQRRDENEMSSAIRNAESELMFGLKRSGFGGYSDGSGTGWRNNYKPLYNKTNAYNGSVEPNYGR